MFRRLLLASALIAMVGFAFAQNYTYTVKPTENPEARDAIAKGATSASVSQTVELILPKATALHLDASTIKFDLSELDGPNWADRANGTDYFGQQVDWPACVTAVSADVRSRLDDKFWNQTQTMPGGTKYDTADWPNITVTGARVTTYPPLRLDADGELIDGSKNYFVCYQSFIIQTFSNFRYWDLQVSRNDAPGSQPIEHLYVQGNTCSDFGTPTGLYALNDGADPVHLIPRNINAGTTGMQVIKPGSKCDYNDKSWLDVLGVLAIKVNSDYHGESTANLTYTLVSSDNQF